MVSPALGEGFKVDGSGEQVLVAGGSVIKMIDIGDRYFGGVAVDDFDCVSGSELTFFDHRKVEAAGLAFDEALDHVVAIEADGDFVAGDAGLRDLHKSRANAEPVADVERVFEQAFGGQIFAERSPGEIRLRQLLAPVGVVLGGIAVDGFVGATVNGEVGLAISTEIELFEFDGAFDRAFKDTSGDLRSLPEDDAGTADVDGDKFHLR